MADDFLQKQQEQRDPLEKDQLGVSYAVPRRRAIFASKSELIRMPVNLSIKNAPDDILV